MVVVPCAAADTDGGRKSGGENFAMRDFSFARSATKQPNLLSALDGGGRGSDEATNHSFCTSILTQHG